MVGVADTGGRATHPQFVCGTDDGEGRPQKTPTRTLAGQAGAIQLGAACPSFRFHPWSSV